MFTAIASILGALTGMVPSLLDFFKVRENNKQELELAKLQMEAAKQGHQFDLEKIRTQSDAQQQQSLYAFDNQSSGSAFMDAFRASVRPVITYCFFVMWIGIELTVTIIGIRRGTDLLSLLKAVWDENTQAMFAAIVSFWFGNRMIEKFWKPQGSSVPSATVTVKRK